MNISRIKPKVGSACRFTGEGFSGWIKQKYV